MSSGIGGAVFFSPLFMLGLKLDPRIAIGAALANELCGFSSGLLAYYKSKLTERYSTSVGNLGRTGDLVTDREMA